MAANSIHEFVPYREKKGEQYMSQAQRAHFRKILENWKRRLMQGVDNTVAYMKTEMGGHADVIDLAAELTEFNLKLKAGDRERKLIKKIEKTLDNIKDHNYGYCNECGIEIGIRRLEARPTATKCVDCKTFAEIREKQVGA